MTVCITLGNNCEFVVDDNNNLSIQRRNNWGTTSQEIVLGPLTHHRIDGLNFCLEQLRAFAEGPDTRKPTS